MKNYYNQAFYKNRHKQTEYSARTVLGIAKSYLPPINSAIDFGCGVGTWLATLQKLEATDVQGVDGPWVDKQLLEISMAQFHEHNFEHPYTPARRYDLAISLEVAEHIMPAGAVNFVRMLTDAADFVLFSAAIPHQGGVNHVNEQWIEYWNDLFKQQGYVGMDLVRPHIWNDADIPFWYRQNIIIYVRATRRSGLTINMEQAFLEPRSYVHPLKAIKLAQPSVQACGGLFIKAFIRGMKRRLLGKK